MRFRYHTKHTLCSGPVLIKITFIFRRPNFGRYMAQGSLAGHQQRIYVDVCRSEYGGCFTKRVNP